MNNEREGKTAVNDTCSHYPNGKCNCNANMLIKLFYDGNQWCALLGENWEKGITGFGKTEYEALKDFVEEYGKCGGVKL